MKRTPPVRTRALRPGLRLGVDVGGTQVKLALVDQAGRVKAAGRVDTVRDPRVLTARIQNAVRSWGIKRCLGTGVGVAGDVDSQSGVVRISPNLGWKNVPLRERLASAGLPAPILVDNDANAAAWGAYFVELEGRPRNLVALTLGTGVGGGLVLDGKLYRGATGSAGELGHVAVDAGGEICGCGARGCLETFLGRDYLVRSMAGELVRLGRKVPPGLTPLEISRRARRGDPAARRVWEKAGRALGVGLAGFINIFNPDVVLLTGGIAGSARLLLRHAGPEIRRRAFATPRRAARLLVSAKNHDLGVIGAALLVE
ncbi:MAG: ROK family protein [Elusimicrobiota bacterium]